MPDRDLVALVKVSVVANLPVGEGRQVRPLPVPIIPDQPSVSVGLPAGSNTLGATTVQASGAVFEVLERAVGT